jgi:hypothetical protein
MTSKSFSPVFLRTPNNYDTNIVSDETGLACLDPTLAQQSFKDECDINTIMDRFGKTGQLPDNPLPPQFGDFTQATDYHAAMNAIAIAHESFDALPARLRARFDNDPEKLIEFVADPENFAEAQKLGMLQTIAKQIDPTPAQPVPPPDLSAKTSPPPPDLSAKTSP